MGIYKITGKDNEKIKHLKKLKQVKYRDKFAEFFVENTAIIIDGLKAGYCFKSLFATEKFIKKNREKFKFILDKSGAKEYCVIDEKINKAFSNLDTAPGICAVYAKEKKEIDFNAPVVYLNGISDPGNLGTIMRSALAFSLKNIAADEFCADIYNYKTINAAKDAIFKLNIAVDKNLALLKKLKQEMKIFSTRMKSAEDAVMLKKRKKFCLVLGGESRGVSEEIEKLADGFVTIEMSGDLESLNVAAAAAIIFYIINRQS